MDFEKLTVIVCTKLLGLFIKIFFKFIFNVITLSTCIFFSLSFVQIHSNITIIYDYPDLKNNPDLTNKVVIR